MHFGSIQNLIAMIIGHQRISKYDLRMFRRIARLTIITSTLQLRKIEIVFSMLISILLDAFC